MKPATFYVVQLPVCMRRTGRLRRETGVPRQILCGVAEEPPSISYYHDSESFWITSFLASTREHNSQRFLSGSMVSL